MRWIATTEAGTTYSYEDGGVSVSGRDGDYFRNYTLRSVPGTSVSWADVHSAPEVEVPVVGERIYLWTLGDAGWRLSTPVVSVEVIG